ncbi:MAG: neutral/alkaline non-lysosomal ceramidase N-terminal domain-containing protein [Chromatiales bacterium]|jgi:neutral ceramidase
MEFSLNKYIYQASNSNKTKKLNVLLLVANLRLIKALIGSLVLAALLSFQIKDCFSQEDNLSISADTYNIGAAKVDITGPFVSSSTGYNSPGDEMSGLAMRLYSRTFVIEQPGVGLVALVTADQLHMYQSVKLGVIKKLKEDGYSDLFNEKNVLVAATHTHAASSNISWYTLFNLFNGVSGFDELHYNTVVTGITQSIIDAYDNRRAATIKFAEGKVSGGSYNRSTLAYKQNMDADDYSSSVDENMRLLRFDAIDGTPIGLLNWFGVHGTSLDIDNRRIHGDNKGWAAYRFEKTQGGDFVAAFAQGPVGDSSPNYPNPDDVTLPFFRPVELDSNLDDMENPIVAGSLQYQAALSLYNGATVLVPVSLDFRHTYVDFNRVSIQSDYVGKYYMPWDTEADTGSYSTCIGVIGAGFLAGDEEGAPVNYAAEGVIKNEYIDEDGQWVQHKFDFNSLDTGGITDFLGAIWPLAQVALQTNQYDVCHKEKFALLPVGKVDDFWFPNPNVPFVPVNIPLQIIRLGNMAIMGTPFETSTMTGRRLRQSIASTLASAGIDQIILADMVNSYGQYLVTREEYAAQHYEGSFAIYGPWASAAVNQELDRLAADLVAGKSSVAGQAPPDLSSQQFIETEISSIGVVTDGGTFGEVLSDAQTSYSALHDKVQVQFRGAHPRTILEKKLDGDLEDYYDPATYTFLEIQKKSGESWVTIATDTDPYTSFDWEREGGKSNLSDLSVATVTWLVRNQEPGAYRIKYNGLAKRWLLFFTIYESFVGYSTEFELL